MVLGLLATSAGVAGCTTPIGSTGSSCDTSNLPAGDPCKGKSCCDSVYLGPDGGVIPEDAGNGHYRMCGSCNG